MTVAIFNPGLFPPRLCSLSFLVSTKRFFSASTLRRELDEEGGEDGELELGMVGRLEDIHDAEP